jgi:hypothetical protein
MATRMSSELSTGGHLQTRMCLITPRPSSGTMARSIRVGFAWVSYPVCNISRAYKTICSRNNSNTANVFSPSIDPTQPDATFCALYYYNLIPTLITLATATCSTGTCSQYHLPLPPQVQSPRLPCLSIPNHTPSPTTLVPTFLYHSRTLSRTPPPSAARQHQPQPEANANASLARIHPVTPTP